MRSLSDHLSEEDAHRLLARAVELDARQDRPITIAELRSVALEAGIAPEAFDRAVAEQQVVPTMPETPTTLWGRVKPTLKAAFVTWVALVALVRICALLGVGWELRDLADVVALATGAVAAHRFGARVARTGLIGMTAALLAEWVIHSVYGIGVVQGFAAHVAVLGAGLFGAIGVAAATFIARPKEIPYEQPTDQLATSEPKAEGETRALRLRAV